MPKQMQQITTPRFAGRFFGLFLGMMLVLITASYLSGCSSAEIKDDDVAALFKDAESDASSSRFQIAIDKFRAIKSKFPYSKFAVEAQLKIADIYFQQESYAEAAAAYEAFKDLHPKHEKVAYAMFRTGKAHFNDAPENVARDLGGATRAVTAYNEFLRRFPSAPEAEEGKKDLAEMRDRLAKKEMYIAGFYMKQNLRDSALPRLQKIVELYPDTPTATEAKAKVEEIREKAAK